MHNSIKKPKPLVPGSTIAIVSTSWGGPSIYPHVLDRGIESLKSLGYKVIEMPTARMDAKTLHENPALRANDLNKAFADPTIDGIICSIGGSDSVRILEHLDVDSITANPKLLMGFSDTTTQTAYLNIHGLVTFNGPSAMAGFCQLNSFPRDYRNYLADFLGGKLGAHELPTYGQFSEGYGSWSDPALVEELKPLVETDGPRFLQGQGTHRGRLFGGCIDVLEMIKGTRFWPSEEYWDGKVLFFETSDEKPPMDFNTYWLRNYGIMGVFYRISGILYGRARGYTMDEKKRLDEILCAVVGGEFGRKDLPIVSNCDFGHTDPQLIMPLGVEIELDMDAQKLRLCESAFS